MRSLCVARAPSAAEAALNWGALRRGLKPRPFKTVLFQDCSFSKLFFFKTVLFQNCSFSKLFFVERLKPCPSWSGTQVAAPHEPKQNQSESKATDKSVRSTQLKSGPGGQNMLGAALEDPVCFECVVQRGL
jgi:hypothetical protein